MTYRKEYQIDGKTVAFRASRFTPIKYRVIYGRSFERDLEDIELAVATNDRELSGIAPAILRRFIHIAHLMASEAEPSSVPRHPDAWLEQFQQFSVYEVAPYLSAVWQGYKGETAGEADREELPGAEGPREAIKRVISGRIAEKYKGASVESVTVNDDLGNEETGHYIALVNASWGMKRSKAVSLEVLARYSADLAATVAARCPELQELAIFWAVPRITDVRLPYRFERSEDRMVEKSRR